MKNRMVRALIITLCVSFLIFTACGKNNNDSNDRDAFTPGGVITKEPGWTKDVAISYGGKELDTSIPGSYGYYSEDGEYATIYDADERPFTFRRGSIKKIINLWPANTAGILALGAEEFFAARLGVGNSLWQEVMFPIYSGLKTQVMTATGTSANVEALMALNPDLIIGHPSSISNLRNIEYDGRKLPVLNVNFSTYQEMKVTYRVIGKILGGRVAENADAWGELLQANMERIARGLARTTVRPVVYYTAGGLSGLNSTMASSGNSVVMNEWTGYAGGKYWPELMRVLHRDVIAGQAETGVNMELILNYPPQKIFIGGGRRDSVDNVLADTNIESNPWAGIIADIGPDNIRYIPYGLFDWGRFGAESALQLLWAAVNIHPEIFADPNSPDYIDIHKETRDFYTKFADYPISDAQVDDILNGRPPNSTDPTTQSAPATPATPSIPSAR